MLGMRRMGVCGAGLMVSIVMGMSSHALAWGERGHHVICEVASRLVLNPRLKAFLQSRGEQMGHVCNIPDIYWRDLGPQTKEGDDAHFMNPENLGYTAAQVPVDFDEVVRASGLSAPEVAHRLGSSWWRADQFFREAVLSGRALKAASFPTPQQYQDHNHPYNRAMFDMLVSMGLMGHFVGDASQPYHNSADYDGWKANRGGIHGYYESTSVNAMSFSLLQEVADAAIALRNTGTLPVTEGTVVERMKALSTLSASEIKAVEAADHMLSPSHLVPSTVPGAEPHKVYAKRPPAEQGAREFHDLIVPQLARSALLLASFWDEVYRTSGAPDLFHYHSYHYPLVPEFVSLDYVK